MTRAAPLVSVIVPSYNQGRWIGETIRSVLDQSYRPLEVIVVDGASTDETLDVLRTFDDAPELRWISEPDSGVVEAVNKGLAMAGGEIGAIQSSDDAYLPRAVEAAVEALREEPDLAFVFGDVVKVDAEGREISRSVLRPYSLEAVLSKRTWIPQPATFFRLGIARELGGWREEVPYAADTDLWLRMAVRRPARKLDRFLALRRVHEGQRDARASRIVRDYERMIETIPEIREGPRRIRRAARAGLLLHRNRYGPDDPAEIKEARLRRAGRLHPPLGRELGLGIWIPDWIPDRLRPGHRHESDGNGAAARRRYSTKERLGAALLDLPRSLLALARGEWTRLRNRRDRLESAPGGPGVSLVGQPWSSDLHVCHVFPSVGERAFEAAFDEWPVRLAEAGMRTAARTGTGPEARNGAGSGVSTGEREGARVDPRNAPDEARHGREGPKASFVIPFRGRDRLSQLRTVVRSVLGQSVPVECVVVEQAAEPVAGELPDGIRRLHLPHPDDPTGWHKAWAFNEGVRAARADVLILHDADVVVPRDYVAEVLERLDGEDLDVAHLHRFLFCLDRETTERVSRTGRFPVRARPERVRQNWEGGTVAIRRDAFLRIGGYDERFVGWGGEDNEFYDRCRLLEGWRWGYLPFVHLWHPEQPAKRSPRREENLDLLAELLEEPRAARARRLREASDGAPGSAAEARTRTPDPRATTVEPPR